MNAKRSSRSPRNDDARQAVPAWFEEFLIDRSTRKPSPHTIAAYRQDFSSIATLITNGHPAEVALTDITRDSMRSAFGSFASRHEPASIRRCWSTWNVLCDFLYMCELIAANPMPSVGRPAPSRTLPKALPASSVGALLAALEQDRGSKKTTCWYERDRALVLTALLAGLRADELRRANVSDIRTTDNGAAIIHVHGKGEKDRSVPIETELLAALEYYLDSRAARIPGTAKTAGGQGLSRWRRDAPLFVGRDGDRITRGTLQSRVRRAFELAGPEAQPARGALVHGLRHTYATELANAEVSVYSLMRLLGHESMATSQRYITAAALDTRSAAARNPLYRILRNSQSEIAERDMGFDR
jgi:site-specific recombinase XerD